MTIQWKQVCAALVTGLLLGALVGVFALRHRGPNFSPSRQLEFFSRKLDLTPEQRNQVAEILEANRDKIHELNQEVRPRFQEIRKSMREEIRKILTPEQRLKFDEIKERHRKNEMTENSLPNF